MNKLEKRNWWLIISNFFEKFIKGETLHLSLRNESRDFMGNIIIYLNDTDCAANLRNLMIKNEKNLIDNVCFKKYPSSFNFEREGFQMMIPNEEELKEGKEYEFGDIVLLKGEDGNSSMRIFFSKFGR